jgi:hypothetical protein
MTVSYKDVIYQILAFFTDKNMMNSSLLTDLDSLVLTVRNPTSREYIQEAINAYRSRAFRASIISTWIAVTYDIIAKMRELAIQNDRNALQYVSKIESAIVNQSIPQLSKIEDDLLKVACEDFGFLSKQQFSDLERLKCDRNLCAHPAFIDGNDLYQPTPEVVRTHIVHSIIHLLKYPPVQGKAAVEKFFADIKSESFPIELNAITDFISLKYLSRAKESMIRSLIICLLKEFLSDNDPVLSSKKREMLFSLMAINTTCSYVFEQIFKQELSRIYDGLDDNQRLNIFPLLGEIPMCWNWLEPANQLQSKELFKKRLHDDEEKISSYYRLHIFNALSIDTLNSLALQEFSHINYLAQCIVIEFNPRPDFIDRGITILEKAGSYADAEFISQKALIPLAPLMMPEHIKRALLAIINNPRNQILPASGMPRLLGQFFRITNKHFDKNRDMWEQLTNRICGEIYLYADYSNFLKEYFTFIRGM